MRAVVVDQARWEVREIPDPRPADDEVLVRVHASGVCRNDLRQRAGTPGHEPAGEVVAIGKAVRHRRIGDRVGVMLWQSACGRCSWCASGKKLFCADVVGTSLHTPGTHAELICAPADATVLLPDALSYEQSASLFCAGFAAYSGFRAGAPNPGERVAVVGMGGLGHLALQYAKASGFEAVAVTGLDKKKLALELGADAVVADGAGLAAMGGADVILGTSASASRLGEALLGIRPEGRCVIMGVDSPPLQISMGSLVQKRASIIGSQHNDPANLQEALRLSACGRVKVLTEPYPLVEAEAARGRLAAGQVRFRAVLLC